MCGHVCLFVFMCVYMCLCVYVYVFIHAMYTYVCLCAFVCAHVCLCMFVCICMDVLSWVSMCVSVCLCVFITICTFMYVWVCMRDFCVSMYAYVCLCIYVYLHVHVCVLVCLFAYTCLSRFMCLYIYVYVYVASCMSPCAFMNVYVCSVCVSVCIYVQLSVCCELSSSTNGGCVICTWDTSTLQTAESHPPSTLEPLPDLRHDSQICWGNIIFEGRSNCKVRFFVPKYVPGSRLKMVFISRERPTSTKFLWRGNWVWKYEITACFISADENSLDQWRAHVQQKVAKVIMATLDWLLILLRPEMTWLEEQLLTHWQCWKWRQEVAELDQGNRRYSLS